MISIQDLQLNNNWWLNKNYKIPEVKWPQRNLFHIIKKNLKHSLILNIIGLRRVGKSTILKQAIANLLLENVKPENIFYFLLDNTRQPRTTEFLEEVLNLYFSEIQQQNFSLLKGKVYIFLDEIQYIDNWQAILKKYYDLSNQKIKFIITGSQSILLKGKSKESLAGRIFDYYLPPLSFKEFFAINRKDGGVVGQGLPPFDLSDLTKTFAISNVSAFDIVNKEKIISLSKEYIINGQFPEIRKLDSDENKAEYILESVLGKVLDDCSKIFKIEKSDEFKLVAYQLLNNVGSLFELKNIGSEIGLSKVTVENYFEYLKEGFIFEVLYKKHKSLIEQGRISKKVYTPCINFVCALNHYKKSHITDIPEVFGLIIENLVFNVLKEKYGKEQDIDLSFWRKGGKEIDFIIDQKKKNVLVPIEVKFSKNITHQDLRVITNFVKDKNLLYGVVVTRDQLKKEKINGQLLYFIPYYLILLLV